MIKKSENKIRKGIMEQFYTQGANVGNDHTLGHSSGLASISNVSC